MKNEPGTYVVTTTIRASNDILETAKSFAHKHDIPFIKRKKGELEKQGVELGFSGAFIFSHNEMILWFSDHEIRFHPNMAKHRVLQIKRIGRDRMQEAMNLKPGDHLLDCTLGLGVDAIVSSFIVGETGRVVALESELPVYLLVSQGLTSYDRPGKEYLREPMMRIETQHSESLTYMKATETDSFDVVYFDPMFRIPKFNSSGLNGIRLLSNSSPITEKHIAEAMRIARRKVVLKERTGSNEFKRLGFKELICKSGVSINYGVIEVALEEKLL